MTDEQQVAEQTLAPDNTGDATGAQDKTPEQKAEKTFNQADVDRIVTERLERAKKTADTKEQKAREEAEAQSLASQQKFQELAEKRGKQVADMELEKTTMASQLEEAASDIARYHGALERILESQMKDLPDHIQALLAEFDPVKQLEWIAANRDKLGIKNGIPATPKADGRGATEEQRKRGVDSQSRLYSNI